MSITVDIFIKRKQEADESAYPITLYIDESDLTEGLSVAIGRRLQAVFDDMARETMAVNSWQGKPND